MLGMMLNITKALRYQMKGNYCYNSIMEVDLDSTDVARMIFSVVYCVCGFRFVIQLCLLFSLLLFCNYTMLMQYKIFVSGI